MPPLTSERLLTLLKEAGRKVGLRDLLRASGLKSGAQTQIKQLLKGLVGKGLVSQKGERFESSSSERSSERSKAHGKAQPLEPYRERPRVPPPHETSPARRSRLTPYDERPRTVPAHKPAPVARKPEQPQRAAHSRGDARQRANAPHRPSQKSRDDGGRSKKVKQGARGAPMHRESGKREVSPAANPNSLVEGTLHVHRDGFGFVHPSGQTAGENIYLPAHEARRALDNDRVEVEVMVNRGGRTEGRLVRVVDRKRSQAIGIYEEVGDEARVVPRDRGLQPIRVPQTQMARPGDVVKVRLGAGRGLLSEGEGLTGEVSGSLGAPGEPSQEVLSSAYAEGFQDEFPPETMDEADAVLLTVSEDEAREEGRRDLRSLPLVTIDGEDARDFDDAVYARAEGSGWRLWVAIADVTHYVRPGSALDAEGFRRATSVYLPDRVLPMLPERLSNGICSLRPDEDRLCMVAEMSLDAQAKLTSYELYPGVMRSAARCTYGEVQAVLDGQAPAGVPHRAAFKPQFETLWSLAQALNAMRRRRGAIEFDLPETRVVVSEDGTPQRMERRERLNSHRLIEACMLAANEAVARYFLDKKLPSVFRHHGEPDEQKLALFSALAGVYGFHLPKGEGVTPQALNQLLEQMGEHPERRALNQLLLRSMMQAAYSALQVGHYGLGAEHYLHFTSPIRRYPDLLVHRLLKAEWARAGRRSSHDLETETEKLQSMAEHCSDRERAAMRVERDISAYYSTLLMRERVGEEFDATVSSLADFGFFVELDGLFVEGRVRGESLGRGFRFDTAIHALVYPGTGRKIRVGQRIRVRLTSANVERRQLELEPVALEGEQPVAATRPSDRLRQPRVQKSQRRDQRTQRSPQPPQRREAGDRQEGASASSPHPGFDRLRSQGRGAKPTAKAEGKGKERKSSGGSAKHKRHKGRSPRR